MALFTCFNRSVNKSKKQQTPGIRFFGSCVLDQDIEMMSLDEKVSRLETLLKEMGPVVVAFSGGVDSTYLLFVAHAVSENVVAVTAHSAIHPEDELKEAVDFAGRLGVEHHLFQTGEMNDETFLSNPPDRCYYCKHIIFSNLVEFARSRGIQTVVDGSNLDDLGDYRPGRKALKELRIRSPLQEAGLTKQEVRLLLQKQGLPVWNKPALACLASRIPYGSPITREALDRVEKSEHYLRSLGFQQIRVRDYGNLARLELIPDDLPKAIDSGMRQIILRHLKSFGYQYVSLDLEGYRTGSLNEVLK